MSDLLGIIRSEGNSVRYTDCGKGTPLLFIHGWLMSHRVWSLQASLSSSFRVITLDLPGHGNDVDAAFSYHACCESIALLCDRLKLDRVIVVGWSMGAQIAVKAYSMLHGLLAGMVLVSGTPQFCSSSDFACGVSPAEARSMSLRIRKDYHRTAGEFFSSMFSQAEAASGALQSLVHSAVSPLPSREIALAALHELISSDVRALLPLISVPVMLVHGLDDRICLPAASKFMAEQIPSSSLRLLTSAGHAPFLANSDSFNRLISEFVQADHGRD